MSELASFSARTDVSTAGEFYQTSGIITVDLDPEPAPRDVCHVRIFTDNIALITHLTHDQAIELMLGLAGFIGRHDRKAST